VKRSLEGVEGVIEAAVSFKKAKARVEVTGAVTDEMLEDAVSYSGRFKGKVIIREPADEQTR
jgi:copper chaperone CopZ